MVESAYLGDAYQISAIAVLLSIVTSVRILLNFMPIILRQGENKKLQDLYEASTAKLSQLLDLEQPLRSMLAECPSPSFQGLSRSDPGYINEQELSSLGDAASKSLYIYGWARS